MLGFEIKDLSYSLPNDPEHKSRSDESCLEQVINVDPAERD